MRKWGARLSRFRFICICLSIWFTAAPLARAQDAPVKVMKPGKVGTPYPDAGEIKATGGSGTLTWSKTDGDLPPGLSVSTDGAITGTPTAGRSSPYVFTLTVSDTSTPPKTKTKKYSILVPDVPLEIVGSSEQTSTVTDDNKEWEARSIVGYHQAGASSANFTQNFFFDFFIMRALSPKHLWEAKTNLWGDVRIASFPQQVTTGAATVGTFVGNFGGQVSNVHVNQLAQSADFQTGLELRVHTWERNPGGNGVLGYRTVGVIGYAGALGAFQAPDTQMEIFSVPDKSSLQYDDFIKAYPTTVNAKYVGFVPPNRERFFRNYGLGVRFATFDKGAPLAPPATYTVSFGQDEAITYGKFTSVVGKIDVFYPLPLGTPTGAYKFIFLFATANMRLSKATNIPTFALQNPNATSATVLPSDPALAVITVPSTRDTYRFGVGVDLVNLIQSIWPPATTTRP
jgi:hypothetical protein